MKITKIYLFLLPRLPSQDGGGGGGVVATFFTTKSFAFSFCRLITALFAPANNYVLFVLLKLVSIALPPGSVWVDVHSASVVSGMASEKGAVTSASVS